MVRSLSVILLADQLVTFAVNSGEEGGGEAWWLCGEVASDLCTAMGWLFEPEKCCQRCLMLTTQYLRPSLLLVLQASSPGVRRPDYRTVVQLGLSLSETSLKVYDAYRVKNLLRMVGNTSVRSVKHDRDNKKWPCLKDLQAESDHRKIFSVGEHTWT